MDWYGIAKFIHVACATAWLGGGLTMIILGMKAERARDDGELVRIVRNVIYLAERVFIPGAAAALVFGVIAVWLGQSWRQEWIWVGLIGFAITFSLGVFLLKPMAEQITAEAERDGASAEVVRKCRRFLRLAKFDYVMLYTIAADMVFKPMSGDTVLLVLMALVVATAALYFHSGEETGRNLAR